MPVSAETLRKLMDAGLAGDVLLDVVASIDADGAAAPKVRSSGAIRQERYRQRKSESERNSDVTSDASRDAAVPSPKESPQTPKETPPSIPSTQQENPLRGQKKGSRLPDEFEPDFDFAVAHGLTRQQAETEWAKFRDFWMAKTGQGATKQDWMATWRNWVRSAVERMGPRPRAGPRHGKPSPMDHFTNYASEINGKAGNSGSLGGDRDDASGVPVIAIEHHH